MPINFPIAGSTGELYTSDLGDRWRWNGYAWDNINLQFSGNYQQPWVIFNRSDVPTYYSSLASAINAAKRGQTIYLCCDYAEILTITNPIILKSDVKINLNGNRYGITIHNASTGTIVFLAEKLVRQGTFPVEDTNYSIVNGTINITGTISGFNGLYLQGGDGITNYDFTDLIVYMDTPGSNTCYLDGLSEENTAEIHFTRGSFYNLSTSSGYGIFIVNGKNDWLYSGADSCPCHVKDCYGWSDTKTGIYWTGVEIFASPLESFDYMIVTYSYDNQIINGSNRDLDSATRFLNTGSVEDNKIIGCGQNNGYRTPLNNTPLANCFLYQPGDDVGNGQGESIVINFKNLESSGVSQNNNIRVELYAGWCRAPIPAVANISVTTYLGGTLTETNQVITSNGIVVTTLSNNNIPIVQACCGVDVSTKTHIGTVYYNLTTKVASVIFY